MNSSNPSNPSIEDIVSQITKAICGQIMNENTSAGVSFPSASSAMPRQSYSAGTAQPGLAERVDYTLLKADATEDQVKELCEEAAAYGFGAVCINSAFTDIAVKNLAGTPVKVSCVVGFPLGAAGTEAKAAEAAAAVKGGAAVIEMVAHVGMIKSQNWAYFKNDIEGVKQAVAGRARLRVILETSLLSRDEKFKACMICSLIGGVDGVKTSTGFSSSGATTADIHVMREAAGDKLEIVASGGIRTQQEARELLKAGADRIGTGNGIAVVTGRGPEKDSGGHVCIGCGSCKATPSCPTGRVDIIVANNY